jgi:hypothetical protein
MIFRTVGQPLTEACSIKIGAIPETLFERLALAFGLVPTPFIDTFHAVIVARAIMVATKLDVFDALASKPMRAIVSGDMPPPPPEGAAAHRKPDQTNPS